MSRAVNQFEVVSRYKPAGDQPEAIAKMIDGLESGLASQTLLGVTGSGKSIGYDDPIYLVRLVDGQERVEIVRAGPFIDGLIESKPDLAAEGDTERYDCLNATYLTEAYDPADGQSGLHKVGAFLRHRAPGRMFRLTTRCGRAVTLTGDHNLWVLRDGKPTLVRTDEVQPRDCVPTPDSLEATESLEYLDIIPYFGDSDLSVFDEAAVDRYIESGGRTKLMVGLPGVGLNPYAKLFAIRQRVRGSGIKVRHYLRLVEEAGVLEAAARDGDTSIGGKKPSCRLPARLLLSDSILTWFGLYIAEGNAQAGYFSVANRHPVLRAEIENAMTELGVPFSVRPSSDYQISSTALAHLMRKTCGSTAAKKHLPDFWPRLSDHSLGLLLRGYFDGDGTVESNGEVTTTTASETLASDLAYALKRFGVHARIRRNWKRATNSEHPGAFYNTVVISGAGDLASFAECIGFAHPEKAARLASFSTRDGNTNVDLVPIDGRDLRRLRQLLSMHQNDVADLALCSRPMISMIEGGKRQPSRTLLRCILDRLEVVAKQASVTDIAWWATWKSLCALCSIRWTPVGRVEAVRYEHPYVYDLSVPGPETFYAGHGGLIVHNTFSIANVIEAVKRPTLVLAPNKTLAAQLYGEFKEFFPHNAVEYFVSYYDYYQPEAYVPSSDTYIEKDSSVNAHIEQMRLSATKAIIERRDTIIVASVSAIYGLGDPGSYLKMVLHLDRGDQVDQRYILVRLAELQYTRNDMAFQRGSYRVRGDVIDIFPAESEKEAVRVELFDDEIDNLSVFDPLTGEVINRVPRYTIFPKTHYVTPRERILAVLDDIKVEMADRLAYLTQHNKLVEAQRLEQRTRFDLEMIRELGFCNGIENYSRYLSGRQPGEPPPTLFDYLPKDALLVVDESHVTVPQIGGMFKGDRSRKETLVEYGFRLPSALDNRPLRFEEWERLAPQMIFVSATPGPYEARHAGQVVEQVVRPTGLIDPMIDIRPASTQVDDLFNQIQQTVALGDRVLVTTLTKRMAEDLTEYLDEHGIRVRYLHSDIDTIERMEIIRDLRMGEFDVLVGINLLREGLDMPEVSLVAILDADKEGFLRSGGSLIQTIGRAARNLRGRAILYADRMTGSMQRAIGETERRRNKQIEFNEAHGITPRSIQKSVADIMEGARAPMPGQMPKRKVAEPGKRYRSDLPTDPKALGKLLRAMEEQMLEHARNLEFEEAAQLRDEIHEIRAASLLAG